MPFLAPARNTAARLAALVAAVVTLSTTGPPASAGPPLTAAAARSRYAPSPSPAPGTRAAAPASASNWLGVLYVIWFKQIWLPSSGWKAYNGGNGDPSSDHTNHVHLSAC